MSTWGQIIDRLETHVRAAVPAMPAGSEGWTRGPGKGETLPTSQVPHAFAHDPVETTEDRDEGFGQRFVQFAIRIDIWFRDQSQEEVALQLDALRAAIHADRKLGGLVTRCWVSQRAIQEVPGKLERNGVVIVAAEWVD